MWKRNHPESAEKSSLLEPNSLFPASTRQPLPVGYVRVIASGARRVDTSGSGEILGRSLTPKTA